MEYSKEDLMEAKKQIWGVGENMGTEESKKIWEENAQFWDNAMGDESNEFHREVVRPKVTELLSPNPALLRLVCKDVFELAAVDEASLDVAGGVGEAHGVAAQGLEPAVDGFGGSVA